VQYSMFAPGKDEKVIVDTTNLKLYEFSTFENFNYINFQQRIYTISLLASRIYQIIDELVCKHLRKFRRINN
jgi:hypothetical protein